MALLDSKGQPSEGRAAVRCRGPGRSSNERQRSLGTSQVSEGGLSATIESRIPGYVTPRR